MDIGWLVFSGIIFLLGITILILGIRGEDSGVIATGIAFQIFSVLFCITAFLCSSDTLSGINQQGNFENGLTREIIVTTEDGREIYYYCGKIDIETNSENKYILFETEEGLRQMIYYGITDTVLILETED